MQHTRLQAPGSCVETQARGWHDYFRNCGSFLSHQSNSREHKTGVLCRASFGKHWIIWLRHLHQDVGFSCYVKPQIPVCCKQEMKSIRYKKAALIFFSGVQQESGS